MNIEIFGKTYEVGAEQTLLSALEEAQLTDETLIVKSGCKSGVCGACAVRVNSTEKLACGCKAGEGDRIEPLKFEDDGSALIRAQAWLVEYGGNAVDEAAAARNEKQSDCILCNSCYSICPVLQTNPAFLGPFALTRVWRYVLDPREAATKLHIEAVQANGVWDCTLCGYCTTVCPQGIDSKGDILALRSRSAVLGLQDPNIPAFGAMNFGFDPNQGF